MASTVSMLGPHVTLDTRECCVSIRPLSGLLRPRTCICRASAFTKYSSLASKGSVGFEGASSDVTQLETYRNHKYVKRDPPYSGHNYQHQKDRQNKDGDFEPPSQHRARQQTHDNE
jgi:hypothetical protein